MTSIPDGFNPTVGGSLDLRSLTSKKPKTQTPDLVLSWQNGKYVLADGIFGEVVHRRDGNFKLKKVNKSETFYLVVADGNCAHGATLRLANSDLKFKLSDRNPEAFKDLNLDSVLSFDDAVFCYRVITGSCGFGVSEFVSQLEETKDSYTIEEILKLTDGEYGNSRFREFFSAVEASHVD